MRKLVNLLRNIGGILLALIIGFCAVFVIILILPETVVNVTVNGGKVLRDIFGISLVTIPICTAVFRKRIVMFIKSEEKKRPIISDEVSSAQMNKEIPTTASEAAKAEAISYSEKAISNSAFCDYDELLSEAVDVIFDTRLASISMLQRRLKLGYSRAICILEQMEELGIISKNGNSNQRAILITYEEWEVLYRNLIDGRINNSTDTLEKVEVNDEVNIPRIIQEEREWQKKELKLSTSDYELYRIDHMEGHAFEHWCADILAKNGFINVEVTPGSNDQGVDVLAEKDGIKYAIQCKCYSSDLGNTPVQEVNTGKSIYHCHVGAVMTNRYFTSGAKAAAAATGILLWDRDKLSEMLKSCESADGIGD